MLTQNEIMIATTSNKDDARFDWRTIPTPERLSKSSATIETFRDRLTSDSDGVTHSLKAKRVRMTGSVLERLHKAAKLTDEQYEAGKRYEVLSHLARGSQIKSSLGQFAGSRGGNVFDANKASPLDRLIALQHRLTPQERISLDMIIWQDIEPVLCGKTLDSKLRVYKTQRMWRALAMKHLKLGLDKI
jgi:hypothetical protein